jgi:phosphatidylinositol alpha-1,6-mannosyltransferase
MQQFERVLVICPEFGATADGSYKPGGLQQFSRCVLRALASSDDIRSLTGWGLLDSDSSVEWLRSHYLADVARVGGVDMRGFSGNRRQMGWSFLKSHARYDLVMFLHTGVARLAVLRPQGRSSLWLVGIDVRRRFGWRERFAVRRADPLLSISAFSSDEMQRHNPNLPAGQTVHLCAEPDKLWLDAGDDGDNTARSYSAASRAPAVLIVARQSASQRYKGHDQLISGWPRVLERVPDAELWIAGSGNDNARLEAMAWARGPDVKAKIRFLGETSHEQLVEHYSTARVFAMPSTGEGFGLVFTEAMRYGMPCICSRDAAAEIVVHGETGLVVDQDPDSVAEACIRLLTDFDLANRMSKAGRLRYEKEFTFDAMRERVFRALRLGHSSTRQESELQWRPA